MLCRARAGLNKGDIAVAKIIGIDLGTTNSAGAVMEGGEPAIIPSSEGGRLFPSVVAVNPKTGERMVGQVARQSAAYSHTIPSRWRIGKS